MRDTQASVEGNRSRGREGIATRVDGRANYGRERCVRPA